MNTENLIRMRHYSTPSATIRKFPPSNAPKILLRNWWNRPNGLAKWRQDAYTRRSVPCVPARGREGRVYLGEREKHRELLPTSHVMPHGNTAGCRSAYATAHVAESSFHQHLQLGQRHRDTGIGRQGSRTRSAMKSQGQRDRSRFHR